MRSMKFVITFIFTFVIIQPIFGQNEPTPPTPPEMPEEMSHNYWELSEQEEQNYLNDLDAELKLKLKEIKKHDAEKYAEFLRELHWKQMETHYMAKGKDKERMELERKIVESEIRTEALALNYQSASSTDKEQVKKDLAKNVGELFDQKEQQRKWEVEMLESEIEELKQKITSRQKNKQTIIRRRVEELLGVEEDLEWD
jgi:hypothetical protein